VLFSPSYSPLKRGRRALTQSSLGADPYSVRSLPLFRGEVGGGHAAVALANFAREEIQP
jgi:hypothetical protein